MAKDNVTPIGRTDDLTKLSGYEGSIQGTTLDTALEELRTALFEAKSIIDSVAHAIEREFGHDCPAGRPEFPRALRTAGRMLDTVADGMEAGTLEDRGLEIARADAKET